MFGTSINKLLKDMNDDAIFASKRSIGNNAIKFLEEILSQILKLLIIEDARDVFDNLYKYALDYLNSIVNKDISLIFSSKIVRQKIKKLVSTHVDNDNIRFFTVMIEFITIEIL